jgi:NADH-quinone oxidoreductase subunit M
VSALLVVLLAAPLLGCIALVAVPATVGDRIARLVGLVVSGVVLLASVAVAATFDYGSPGTMQFQVDAAWAPAFDLRFHLGVDGVSLPLVVLTALLVFLCLVYSIRHVPRPGRPRAFVALILLLEVGMLGTFVALDLVLFFVVFEIVLVPMYFLIAVWGGEGRQPAATKFILYTVLGSVVMLLGFLVIYAQTGTFDMIELADRGGEGIARGIQIAAFLAIGIGFAVKTPLWPLHTWLPDAHTAAPTVGSVLLAGVLLKMGTYGFVRIALPVLPDGARAIAPALGVLAVIGIVYGSLACLAQHDLKRLIAYSSVGHMGFVVLGIATLTAPGINGALFANVAHGLITGLLFFLAGAVKDRHGTADMSDLGRGLYARVPRLAALLAFAAVASLGLPGLAGFWGEMLAMLGAFRPDASLDRPLFLVLMVVAGLGTVLTAAYLLQMVRRVNQGISNERWTQPRMVDVTGTEWSAWTPLVIATIVVGLCPWLLLDVTNPAVQVIVGGAG